MFTPLILFLGLTVATAVIAYWSDNLGKKLGKKRVSLLGMRPRTTATFLTITSSWAIMVFTLAALLAVVTPLRHALFRYESERAQYRQDIALAETQLKGTTTRLTTTQNSLSGTQNQLNEAQKRVQTERKNTREAQEARRKAETERRNAEARRKNAVTGRQSAEAALRNAQAGVAAAQARVVRAQSQYNAAQKRFVAAQQRENAARRGEKTAQQSARIARLDLDATRGRLQGSREKLRTANASYKAADERLTRTRLNLRNAETGFRSASGAFKRAAADVLALDKQRIELQRQIAELSRAAAYYSETTFQFAGGDVQIPINRTFAARLIAANQTPPNIAATLRALFEQAQRSFDAEQRQKATSEQARLQLLPLPEKAGENVVFLEGEQIFERLARDIAAQNGPTSIRLVAARNFLAGETQIAARFVAVPVAVAFRGGETLASATIDGGVGDARIFNQLLGLIEMARKEADRRGVNPPQSPDEPNFFAAGTNVALFEALRRIEASKRSQRVTLVAAQELSTVEPLRVRFEVESGAASS